MLKNVKTVTKGSLVYGFGNMSVKLVGLVLIPIYTNEKFLSVSDFAVVGIIDITSQLLVSLLGLALSQALTRWYYEKDYAGKQKSMFYSVFVFLILVTGLSLLVFSSFSKSISQLLFDSERFSLALSLMMGSSVMQIWIALLQTLMKIQQKPVLFTITNIIKLLLTLLLTIVFVVYMGTGIEGIYKAQIYGSLLFFLLTAKYLYDNIEFKLDFRMIKEMLRFSFPLILASTSGILISILDKYILNYLATREEVGIYVFAYRMANSLKIFVIASVQMAVSPLLFQLMHDPGSNRFYSKYMTYFAFIVMICVIGLSAFSFEIVHLFAQNEIYYIAWSIIPILSFALFFGMLKDTASTGLQIAKETGIISIITISTTVLNVGLNYISIPKFSYYGSALSFLISQILFFILVYFFAQKKYPIPYELKNILLIVVVGTMLCLLTFVMNDLNLVLRLIIKAFLVLSFPFLLYPFGFYEKIEITRLREAWLKWRNPMKWKQNLRKVNMDF